MKYLFFDIECANRFDGTGKICEFGYIVTDQQFCEMDRGIFIINPRSQYDWYVLKNMLAYKKETYNSSPDYLHYFNDIKKLFTDNEMLILGHTTDSDIKYLNDEAKRYSLPFFTCKFYDVKYMYNTFAGKPNSSYGVSKICDELGIQRPDHAHRSVDDAYATMEIVKEICARMSISVCQLIDISEDCKGETCEGIVKTVVGEKARVRREELEMLYGANIKNNFIRGENKVKFLQFLDGVKPQDEILQCELTGKKLCISLNYEYTHFKEMLSIVQLLANRGCKYLLKATDCDLFVTFNEIDTDGNERTCSRLNYVNKAIADGSNISIISFDELLKILEITEEELIEMPFPPESAFVSKQKDNLLLTRYQKSCSVTFGDLCMANGIDLRKIL